MVLMYDKNSREFASVTEDEEMHVLQFNSVIFCRTEFQDHKVQTKSLKPSSNVRSCTLKDFNKSTFSCMSIV
jgi:hypothetical protein